MKELSIEEKAKRYDEAIRKAKITLGCCDSASIITEHTIYDIFPELRESEDDRIRKEIIDFLWKEKIFLQEAHSSVENNPKYRFVMDAIAWLEKQGESDETKAKMFLMNKGYPIDANGTFPTYEEMYNIIREGLEEQSKQKFADNVEPKFKVGDWTVSNLDGKVRQISEVHFDEYNSYYVVNWVCVNIEEYDRLHHLWTIQDAKDGDVLCYKDEISLYKHGIKNCTEQGMDFGGFVYYCCYDGKRFIMDSLYSLIKEDKIDIHLASKEQRDLLFQKMKEVGYEWDAEKKELKKIEPIDEYEGLTDFERTVADICIGWIGKEIGWKEYIKDNSDILLKIAVEKFNSVQDAPFEQKPTDEEMKELLHTEYEKGKADAIAEMQNPAWSEGDEERLQSCLNILQAKGIMGVTETINTKWLKSIKNRVQPKQEWSEEDERIYKSISYAFEHNFPLNHEQHNFIKSLKNRVQSKPILRRTHTIFDQII